MIRSNLTRRHLLGGVASIAATAPSIIGVARAQPASNTFVLVPDAFCGGWIWRRVSDLLERKGHKVFSPTLTGLGERSHLLSKEINLDTHITDIVNVVKWESLNDVCLVVHSYAGWVGSGAIEQIGDRVSSIVWLDAYKPESGQRPLDFSLFQKVFQRAVDEGQAGFGPPPGPPPPRIFVNERDEAFVGSKLTPQPIGTYSQAIRLTGARDKVAKKHISAFQTFPTRFSTKRWRSAGRINRGTHSS